MRWVDAARPGDPRQALITDIDEARRAADWARERARREERARGRRGFPPIVLGEAEGEQDKESGEEGQD